MKRANSIRSVQGWLVAATFAVFAQTLFFGLSQIDDHKHIFENPRILNFSFESLRFFWTNAFFSLYIPVVYTVWGTIAKLSTVSSQSVTTSAYHLLNVATHCFNVFLVSKLLQDFGLKRTGIIFGTLLFALHPLQVETVAWISAYKDLVSCMFAICALLFFHRRRNLIATLCFIAGILSKPHIAVLPLLVVTLHLTAGTRLRFKSHGILLLWACLGLAVSCATRFLQPEEGIETLTPFLLRPLVFLDALGFYIRRLIVPFPLVIDYARAPNSLDVFDYVLASFVAVPLFLIWRHRSHPVSRGLIWFVIALLPVSGLIPFKFQKFSTVSDHYMYFPIIGCSMAVGWLMNLTHKTRIAALTILAFAAGTFVQSSYWKDDVLILQHTLHHRPQSFLAHNNLGVAHFHRMQFHEAAYHFGKAAEILPNEPDLQANLGASLLRTGRIEEGKRVLWEARTRFPKAQGVLLNLAQAQMTLNERRDALETLNALVLVNPNNAQARKLLAELGR